MILLSQPKPGTMGHDRLGSARYLSRGFSLLEVAVALVVIGLMASASSTYFGLFRSSNQLAMDANLVSLSGSVITFAVTRNRLPCPDTAGTGYESLVGGVCPLATAVGWLPYQSLGLSQPAPLARAIYGVYRNPAANADLAATASLATLSAAASQLPNTNSLYIYLTGDGTTANGVENCVGNIATNPAFVILSPGEDRDGNGSTLDGIHSTLPATGRCFAAPTRGVDSNFDDRTFAVSAFALMAKLNP
jgi:prepilin-type N-terminal cleavage/methylation domain-containing protein